MVTAVDMASDADDSNGVDGLNRLRLEIDSGSMPEDHPLPE